MRATSLLLIGILFLVAANSASSDDSDPSNPTSEYRQTIVPFLTTYCVDCHTGDDAEAELRFDLSAEPDVAREFEQWTVILQRVGGQEMPPEDVDQPTDQEREAFVNWVNEGLSHFDCTQQEAKPRTTLRRLNRFEYDNVIGDLLHVQATPARAFPADDVGEGFDNIGEVLSLPPLLMEKYLDAAELITKELAQDEDAWQRVFHGIARRDAVKPSQVEPAIEALAQRAFRRPLEADELARLMKLFDLAVEQDVSTGEALDFVTQAVLISPQFLFRLERDPLADPTELKPLNSHAIASQLSFFLWSTIPDDELNQLAEQDQLTNPDVIAAQAKRMLKHPNVKAFVESFAGQWLELRLLGQAKPDPDLFPDFDDGLRLAMIEETSEFFRELVVNDRSVMDLIDSDYTFLNDRLAQHYGIEGIEGEQFRRVKLESDRRGGILTQASILTLTSNPTRTSPVKRGKWILENILGTPPPPPPANVPELEEGDELLGSLRERMQQHRENPSCAVCHRKMDALGFGFENFDAIGGWREKDGRYDIDASGELPGKVTFTKPAELRQILRSNSREFTSCLTRKLLTYSLGRALSSRDKCLVDDIVDALEQREHRFSELIVAIVTSDAFRFSGVGAKK